MTLDFTVQIFLLECSVIYNLHHLSVRTNLGKRSITFGHHCSVDWSIGLDYWTGLLDSWKVPLEEKETTMCRAKTKTPGHKDVVDAHLNVAPSSVPSHPPFFVSGWEPGRGYISTLPTSTHAHYELL